MHWHERSFRGCEIGICCIMGPASDRVAVIIDEAEDPVVYCLCLSNSLFANAYDLSGCLKRIRCNRLTEPCLKVTQIGLALRCDIHPKIEHPPLCLEPILLFVNRGTIPKGSRGNQVNRKGTGNGGSNTLLCTNRLQIQQTREN